MSIAFDADFDPPAHRFDRRMLATAALACFTVISAVGARVQLVRLAPRTAVLFEAVGLPVNLSGLALDRISAKIMADGDRRVLVVEGEIVNAGDRDEPARPLSVSVRGAGREPLYTWVTRAPRQMVGAGERAAFVARLASPPSEGASVAVEFDRSDVRPKKAASLKAGAPTGFQGSRTESQ